MGLILDSSVLIAAERKGQNAHQALAEIAVRAAGEDVAMSVVTLIELAHGVGRANTPQRKATRRQFLNELMTALPVHPVTVPVALRAGQIDGENTAQGVRVALSDLLIGVTALELGYRELNPKSCKDLLRQWSVTHRRRKNLWRALQAKGLSMPGGK